MSQRWAQDQNPGAESDLPWKVRPIHCSAWTQWVFWGLAFSTYPQPRSASSVFQHFALEFSSRLCSTELMVPCEFLRGEIKCLGSEIHVFLYAETPIHKVNTYMVLVICRGRTICKKPWLILIPVGVSCFDSREVELILM